MKEAAADMEASDERVSDALWYENHIPAQLRTIFIEERCEQAGYPLNEED